MTHPFDRDTAVVAEGDGRYRATMSTDWWVARGPNGGYLAAILVRALAGEVDPDRSVRSLTVHYTRAPGEGDVLVDTQVERVGRSMTTVTARMSQDDRLVALAVAAFSTSRPSIEFCDVAMPQVPPPPAYASRAMPAEAPPIAHRYDTRWAIGYPPGPPGTKVPSGARAVAGGWIRLPEPRVVDAPLLAAITDGWVPPTFSRVQEPVIVPTVDLTIHFRSALPHPGLAPDDFVLASFRTNVAHDGFLEEDGEVWAPDGTLLAQSRQLATVMPFRT